MSAAPCALRVPAAAPIERSQVGQQPMQGCVEVRRLLGDPLAQRLEIHGHGQCIARYHDIAISSRLTSNESSTGSLGGLTAGYHLQSPASHRPCVGDAHLSPTSAAFLVEPQCFRSLDHVVNLPRMSSLTKTLLSSRIDGRRRWHRSSSKDVVLNQPAEIPQRGT